jgi:hypothetical protein
MEQRRGLFSLAFHFVALLTACCIYIRGASQRFPSNALWFWNCRPLPEHSEQLQNHTRLEVHHQLSKLPTCFYPHTTLLGKVLIWW